jgi:hypothetical protein
MSLDVEQTAASIRAGAGVEGNVMEIIPSCLRAAFAAPPPSQFICADLSQIELRVLAWLTSCSPMLEAFAADRELYTEFGAAWYGVPYEQVTKLQRQNSRSRPSCQCGYGAGGGEQRVDKKGDEYKSGLWGYAESMGVSMTQAEAHDAVYLYREYLLRDTGVLVQHRRRSRKLLAGQTERLGRICRFGCLTIGLILTNCCS